MYSTGCSCRAMACNGYGLSSAATENSRLGSSTTARTSADRSARCVYRSTRLPPLPWLFLVGEREPHGLLQLSDLFAAKRRAALLLPDASQLGVERVDLAGAIGADARMQGRAAAARAGAIVTNNHATPLGTAIGPMVQEAQAGVAPARDPAGAGVETAPALDQAAAQAAPVAAGWGPRRQPGSACCAAC